MGYRIEELRKRKGLSQDELAQKAEVSRTLLNGLETGRVEVTSTKSLQKIACALETTIRNLFRD